MEPSDPSRNAPPGGAHAHSHGSHAGHAGHAGHSHGAHAGHHHASGSGAQHEKRLLWTLVLAAAYMLAEAVGGYLTGSLALYADAGHMLSDVAALGLSVFAIRISQRPPTLTRTYGHHRTEILAALANGATLVAISIYVVIEACRRLAAPTDVNAPVMMAVATGGLLFNIVGLHLLAGGRDNLNVRGAWLHVATDALGSLQTIVAGGLIWAFGWRWADPVASIVIALLVIYSSWSLLRDAVEVLMEGAPRHLDVMEVREALAGVPGVVGVHDLHVWTITSGREALSAHLVIGEPASRAPMLEQVRGTLADRFGIRHVTVQIEQDECGDGC